MKRHPRLHPLFLAFVLCQVAMAYTIAPALACSYPVRPQFVCSVTSTTTIQIIAYNFISRFSSPGVFCACGLQLPTPMGTIINVQAYDAATNQPLSFSFSPNAATSAALSASDPKGGTDWSGFSGPVIGTGIPAGLSVYFVYTISVTTMTTSTCTNVITALRSVNPNIYAGETNSGGTVIVEPGFDTGEPHLLSMDGLMFDFHTAGDYILATNGSSFMVQTRQEPWPTDQRYGFTAEAAMKVGSSRVEFNGRTSPPLFIDGQAKTMGETTLALPGGGSIEKRQRLEGASYQVRWPSGERVDVLVGRNSSYLDVHVSRSPFSPAGFSGLLGDGDGDPTNDLKSRTGSVLSLTPTAEQFERDFGASWRVRPEESLFSRPPAKPVADEEWAKRGVLGPVGVSSLSANLRSQGESVCRAQGIDNPALLDACIVDVAVTGNSDYAVRLAGMPAPKAVVSFAPSATPGEPTGSGVTGATGEKLLGCRAAGNAPADWSIALGLLALLGLARRKRSRA